MGLTNRIPLKTLVYYISHMLYGSQIKQDFKLNSSRVIRSLKLIKIKFLNFVESRLPRFRDRLTVNLRLKGANILAARNFMQFEQLNLKWRESTNLTQLPDIQNHHVVQLNGYSWICWYEEYMYFIWEPGSFQHSENTGSAISQNPWMCTYITTDDLQKTLSNTESAWNSAIVCHAEVKFKLIDQVF